ncbi:hypothetical protein JYU34_009264 [Plutella xylostella]|uniref:Synembryn n=1 Tax=Plutella xylostella TaxID=51655 RepID=A0ABQ7QJJ6_PLUXY|nr:hypothetical protein JYU34_009264 [Plutella xylostella]
MEENEIGLISSGNLVEVSAILQKFLKQNENVTAFTNLSGNNRRVILWTSIFQHLQNSSSESIHALCLATIRVLSRDKTDIENLMCEKWITILIEKAGLYNFMRVDDEAMMSMTMPPQDIVVEAMKCLCNIAFNSEVARALCAHTSIAEGLVGRLRTYKEIAFKEDIMLFDMKLLFILTALRFDIRSKIKGELHGLDYLISCLGELLLEATVTSEGAAASTSSGLIEDDQHCLLSDKQQAIACEILKAMFNLVLQSSGEEAHESEEATYLKLMPVLTSLLHAHTSNEEKLMELRSNVANLLTSVPPSYYPFLTPELSEGERAQYMYEGRSMDALQSLVNLLQSRLTVTTNTTNQHENLSPILTVMIKGSRGCRAQRKYLRQVVLPPLRDVSLPPERGTALRNQLCRLLTTPVMSVRDLVAEFLFILCKENVGRMVKYTGFGNSAGHLAQKGLLGGPQASSQYSSSSEDSDTEEYRAAEPRIDPVVGCTRPPASNPFEGMTEEQKEYEAMKLVNLFDRLVSHGVVRPAAVGADGRPRPVDHIVNLFDRLGSHGVVRPAAVGADGRPRPVEHVCELRDHPPYRPQS